MAHHAAEPFTNVKRLFEDVLYVLNKEVGRFKAKAKEGQPLTLQESLMLRHYTSTAVKIEQEKRSKDHFDKINAMTDEELKAAVVSLVAYNPELKQLVMNTEIKPTNDTNDAEVYVD